MVVQSELNEFLSVFYTCQWRVRPPTPSWGKKNLLYRLYVAIWTGLCESCSNRHLWEDLSHKDKDSQNWGENKEVSVAIVLTFDQTPTWSFANYPNGALSVCPSFYTLLPSPLQADKYFNRAQSVWSWWPTFSISASLNWYSCINWTEIFKDNRSSTCRKVSVAAQRETLRAILYHADNRVSSIGLITAILIHQIWKNFHGKKCKRYI